MNEMGLLGMVSRENQLEIVFQNRIGLVIQHIPSIDTYNITLNTFDTAYKKIALSDLFIESPIPFTNVEKIPLENIKGKELQQRLELLLYAIRVDAKQLHCTDEFKKIYALRMLEISEYELNQMGITKSDLVDTIVYTYRSDGYDEATGMYAVTIQIPEYIGYLSNCIKNTTDTAQKERYGYIKELLEECRDIIIDIQQSLTTYHNEHQNDFALEM